MISDVSVDVRTLLTRLWRATFEDMSSSVAPRAKHLRRVHSCSECDASRSIQPSRSRAAADPAVGQMCTELQEFLNAKPGTRAALRHLAFLDSVLRRHGLTVLEHLPSRVLRKTHSQLALAIVTAPSAALLQLSDRVLARLTTSALDPCEAYWVGESTTETFRQASAACRLLLPHLVARSGPAGAGSRTAVSESWTWNR